MSWRSRRPIRAFLSTSTNVCIAMVLASCAAPFADAPDASAGDPGGRSRTVAAPPTPAPTTTVAPPRALDPATTRYLVPPNRNATNGDGSQERPWNDFCYAIKHARSGDLLVVGGSRSEPYDFDVAPTTASGSMCRFTPSTTDVIVWGADNPVVKGQLVVSGAIGWTFDNLDVTRSTNMGHDQMIVMIGGTRWRWTNCELWGSAAGSEFAVGNWAGVIPATDWRLDHCFIHDNPGDPSRFPFPSHNLYIFTTDGVTSNGVIEDNVVVGAPQGYNAKIGGTGNAPGEGSDGIIVRRNTFVNNHNDGGNLNICTNSDDVRVENNVLVAQAPPAAVFNVVLGEFSGRNLQLTDNLFWGHDPTAVPPHPLLWTSGTGLYVSIDLNAGSPFVTQTRSVHGNAGYPSLTSSNVAAGFPAVTVGGVRYGPAA